MRRKRSARSSRLELSRTRSAREFRTTKTVACNAPWDVCAIKFAVLRYRRQRRVKAVGSQRRFTRVAGAALRGAAASTLSNRDARNCSRRS